MEVTDVVSSMLLPVVVNFIKLMRDYFRSAPRLRRLGGTIGTVLSYPFRRRLKLRNDLIFRNGGVFSGPAGEHLLPLLLEVWADEIYRGPLQLAKPDEGAFIVDIGANLGAFSIWSAQQFPGTRVVAIEPDADLFPFLRANLDAFRANYVEIVEAACGGTSGSATLYRRGHHSWNTLYTTDNYGNTFRPGPTVRVVPLDEVFRLHEIHKCFLLKLDCEGAEYEVLMKASLDTLSVVENIAMEYHIGLNSQGPEELAAFLSQCGFNVQLRPPIDVEGGYMYASRTPFPTLR
jgi:FkbM family methyltransferase